MTSNKTYLYVTFIILIAVLLSLWGVYLGNYQRFVSDTSASLKNEATSSSEMLQAKIDELKGDIVFLHSVPPIQGIIRASRNNGIDPVDQSSMEVWRSRLGAIFSSYIAAHDDVFQVRYIGLADGGREIVRVDRTQDGILVTPENRLQKKADRDYFRHIIRSNFDGVYVSEIDLNREFGEVQIPHKPAMRFGLKILSDDGDVFGFVIINLAVYNTFAKITANFPMEDNLYITNDSEDFIFHPDQKYVFGFDLGMPITWNDLFKFEGESTDSDVPLYSNNKSTYLTYKKTIPLVQGDTSVNFLVTHDLKNIQASALLYTGYFAVAFLAGLALLFVYIALYRKNMKHQALLNLEKARNSSIVEGSQDAIIGVSMEGRITDWNPGAVTLFGYTKTEALGELTADILLIKETLNEEDGIRQDLLLGKLVKPFETIRLRKDGKHLHVSVSASPIRDDEGNIIGVSKIIRDITEQKEASNKIEELNRSLEKQVEERTAELVATHSLQTAILENAANAVIATDKDGLITHFSPTAETMLGYSADEMVGKCTPALFHLESEVVARAEQLSKELGTPIEPGFKVFVVKTDMGMRNETEWTYVTKSGQRIPIFLSAAALRNEDGEITGYLGMAADISEMVLNRKKLESIRDQLARASEVANLGIWSWEPGLDALQWNAQMYDMYGVDPNQEVTFDDWFALVANEDKERVLNYANSRANNKGDSDLIFDIITKSGVRKTIQASAELEKDAVSGINVVIGINRDVTTQVNYENVLKEAKLASDSANKAKSEFVANMSHEIRTPMNAIIGLLQLLKKTELNPKQEDYVDKSDSAAKSLLHILNDILDFSKVEAGKLEIDPHPFRISDLVENTCSVLAANIGNKDIELVFDVDPHVPSYITLDSLRLQQILVNLAGNSIKFTDSGVVSIAFSYESGETKKLKCVVKDTGIGIAPDKQAKIFEAFNQAETSVMRNYGGTGLGLAISKRLLELMGGSISLASELGVGTTFSFEVPFEDSVIDVVQEEKIAKQKVLVVDDTEEALQAMKHVVESIGWEAHVAESGKKAIQAVADAQSSMPFDIVLMDWTMPEINGWQASQQIRNNNNSAFTGLLFIVTAYGKDQDIRQHKDKKDIINGIIEKPLTPSVLLNRVLECHSIYASGAQTTIHGKRLQGLEVLVVEDNQINQLVAKETLVSEGANVCIADNGAKAIEILNTQNQEFDVILMDVQMPVMDGYTATGKIRQELKLDTPIIAMTANALASDKKDAHEAGMNDHISKPFYTNDLVAVIQKHVAVEKLPTSPEAGSNHSNSHDDAKKDHLPSDMHDAMPILDKKTALSRLADNEALYQETVKVYISESSALLAQLPATCPEQYSDLIINIHSLKGMSGTVGATKLAQQCLTLETALKNNEPNNYEAFVKDIKATYRTTISAIQEDAGVPDMKKGPDCVSLNHDELTSELLELKSLLESSNMHALDLYREIRSRIQVNDSNRAFFDAMDTHMQQLDFAGAISAINKLIEAN